MRNARRVFGNAAIVAERCSRFSVLETRRAHGKPFSLEDGDTGLVESLSWYFFQQGHDTGSSFKLGEFKMRRGEPASRLPSQSPMSPAGLTECRQTSIFGLPFTR